VSSCRRYVENWALALPLGLSVVLLWGVTNFLIRFAGRTVTEAIGQRACRPARLRTAIALG
jgi:hypothetical protein